MFSDSLHLWSPSGVLQNETQHLLVAVLAIAPVEQVWSQETVQGIKIPHLFLRMEHVKRILFFEFWKCGRMFRC